MAWACTQSLSKRRLNLRPVLTAVTLPTRIITSHVLETIESLCTHIGIIHHGRLLLQCAAEDVGTHAESLAAGTGEKGLEELFVRLVSDSTPRAPLSFL